MHFGQLAWAIQLRRFWFMVNRFCCLFVFGGCLTLFICDCKLYIYRIFYFDAESIAEVVCSSEIEGKASLVYWSLLCLRKNRKRILILILILVLCFMVFISNFSLVIGSNCIFQIWSTQNFSFPGAVNVILHCIVMIINEDGLIFFSQVILIRTAIQTWL